MSSSGAAATGPRTDYISKECWYMSMAILASQRSKDPNTKVGGCLVNSRGVLVSMGYNGFPVGCPDSELPWAKTAEDPLETKFPYVCHAELNAILNTNDVSPQGCTLYTTLFPCNECSKMIIQAGITKVVYLCDKSRHKPLALAARKMLEMAGVECVKYSSQQHRRIELDFSKFIISGRDSAKRS